MRTDRMPVDAVPSNLLDPRPLRFRQHAGRQLPTIDSVLGSIEARAAPPPHRRPLAPLRHQLRSRIHRHRQISPARWPARLVRQGHEVTVVTAYPTILTGASTRPSQLALVDRDLAGRPRHPLPASGICPHPPPHTRILHLLSFAPSSAPAVLYAALRHRPETLFVVEPTSLRRRWACQPPACLAAEAWLHVQDIQLGAALNVGLIGDNKLSRLARRIYRHILTRYDRVTTLSNPDLTALAAMGRLESQIGLFPNWVDVEKYRYVDSSKMRAQLGIGPDEFVALYAGAMGEKQGVESLLDVAKLLEQESHIRVILCGDGPARHSIEARVNDHRNIIMLEPLSENDFPTLLSMANCHLLPQKSGITHFVMPSKVGPIMAIGGVIIAQADRDCELRSVLRDTGIIVGAESTDEMAAAIKALSKSPPEVRTYVRKACKWIMNQTVETEFSSVTHDKYSAQGCPLG